MQNYSMKENAFYVLRAAYQSKNSDISNLVEDAEFDEQHPQDLIQRCQQSLISPVARLEQELSWLPELSGDQIEKIKAKLQSDKEGELYKEIKFFPELPKANVLAHLCLAGKISTVIVQDLLRAWEQVNEEDLLEFINDQREIAGFPRANRAQLQNIVKSLGTNHARNAAAAVWKAKDPGKVMEALVEEEVERTPKSSILARFVQEYDKLSEIHLSRISDEIDKQTEKALRSTNKDELVDDIRLELVISRIKTLLQDWDDINQPVQVFEQHQGHEEGRSKKIYEKLRSLCIELANERGEFEHAKNLSEALLETFPELESVAEVLKGDLEALENLTIKQKLVTDLEPLTVACETAKLQHSELKSALKSSGFTQVRRGILKEVYGAFDKVVRAPNSGDSAYHVVRDLALYFNNDLNDPETAFILIDGLINFRQSKPSQDLSDKLISERSVLHRNWKMAELEKKAGNYGAMVKIVDEIFKYASSAEHEELNLLKTNLEHKRNSRRAMWLIFGGIAAAIAFFSIVDEMESSSSRTADKPATTFQKSNQSQTATKSVAVAASEKMPPVGKGHTLIKSQVRYCVFQGKRLEAIRSMISTNYQKTRFNNLVDSYNLRCSNYRYMGGVLSSVRREAQGKSAEFTADAKRIVASW